MAHEEKIHFVPLTEENLKLLPPLFKKAFKKQVGIRFFSSKYDFSAIGKPLLGMLAVINSKAVGFVGVCYQQVAYGNKSEWMADYTDSMVDPDFQKKGIHLELVKRLENMCALQGLTTSYGFSNKNSYSTVVNKRKWDLGKQMIGYNIPVNTFPWQKIFRKFGMWRAYMHFVTQRIKKYTVPYNADLFQTSPDHPDIVRDERYFQWKKTADKFLLRHNGTYIWVKTGGQLSVGYINTSDPDQLLDAVVFLKKIARLVHIPTVMFQFPEGCEQDQILRKHFPHFESWRIAYLNHNSLIPFENIRIQFCDTDSF